MIIAAKTMSATLDHFKDHLTAKGSRKLGSVVIGTVKGDLHDIGKNLVTMMLEGLTQKYKVTLCGESGRKERIDVNHEGSEDES